MSKPAAIKGTFSDFRAVKGRKVAQLIIEVPIEQADAALHALGGVPMPDNPKWVALARLNETPATQPETGTAGQGEDTGGEVLGASRASPASSEREKRKWSDLPAASQIALACEDAQFRKWLNGRTDLHVTDKWIAEHVVRDALGVARKRDVLPSTKAFARWQELYGTFTAERDYGGRAA